MSGGCNIERKVTTGTERDTGNIAALVTTCVLQCTPVAAGMVQDCCKRLDDAVGACRRAFVMGAKTLSVSTSINTLTPDLRRRALSPEHSKRCTPGISREDCGSGMH